MQSRPMHKSKSGGGKNRETWGINQGRSFHAREVNFFCVISSCLSTYQSKLEPEKLETNEQRPTEMNGNCKCLIMMWR